MMKNRKACVWRKLYIIIESLSHDYVHYQISKRNYYDLTCTIKITILHGEHESQTIKSHVRLYLCLIHVHKKQMPPFPHLLEYHIVP